jgi:hypothetical protein
MTTVGAPALSYSSAPVHYPLQGSNTGVKVTPDSRQGDIDNGGVQRGDPRAEHGDRQHPAPKVAAASPLAGASPSAVGRPDRRTSNLKWRIPRDRPACQPRGVGVVGQCSLELQAGADLELGEDLAQVWGARSLRAL